MDIELWFVVLVVYMYLVVLHWPFQRIPDNQCVMFQHVSLVDSGLIGRSDCLSLESNPVAFKVDITCGKCVAFRRLNAVLKSDCLLLLCREVLLNCTLTQLGIIMMNVFMVLVTKSCFQSVLLLILLLLLALELLLAVPVVGRGKVTHLFRNTQKYETMNVKFDFVSCDCRSKLGKRPRQ